MYFYGNLIIILTICTVISSDKNVKIELNSQLFYFKIREIFDFSLEKEQIQIKANIDEQFEICRNALDAMADSVAKHANSTRVERIHKCCNDEGKQFAQKFKQKVLLTDSCTTSLASSPKVIQSRANFTTVAKKNLLKSKHIRWQYYGTDSGVMTIYPGVCLPSNFDPRKRVFYYAVTDSAVKRTVIILDASKTMGNILESGVSALKVGKEVAKAIVGFHRDFDQLAIITLGNRPETLRVSEDFYGGCFTDKFAYGTAYNKDMLVKYLISIKSKGLSHLTPAFKKTFEFFNPSTQNASQVKMFFENLKLQDDKNRINAIHLISDGSLGIDVKTIKSYIEKVKSKFLLLIFAIGGRNANVLRNLEHQLRFNPHVIVDLIRINPQKDVFVQTANAFDKYAVPTPLATIPPYVDIVGLGQLISFCKRVSNGVVCVDISLEDLFFEIANHRPNEYSYGFIMDSNGWLVSHPMLSRQIYLKIEQVFVDSFEPSNSRFLRLLKSLFRCSEAKTTTLVKTIANEIKGNVPFLRFYCFSCQGSAKQSNIKTVRITSAGESNEYGVQITKLNSSYTAVKLDNVNFFLFDVAAEKVYDFNPGPLQNALSFLYHRLDIVAPPNPCVHLNIYSSKDLTSVLLSPHTFKDPSHFFFMPFSKSHIDRIIDSLTGQSTLNSLIKRDALRDVIATHFVQKIWTKSKMNEMSNHIGYRYIGTETGVYRIHPAQQLPEYFEPVNAPWYLAAKALQHVIIMRPPFKHSESGVLLISLSTTLTKSHARIAQKNNVYGVLGIDFLINYIFQIFFTQYPNCQLRNTFKCLVIDQGGYIILADEYLDYATFTKPLHISDIEPQVTSVMIQRGVLERVNCSRVKSGKLMRMYRIRSGQSVFWGSFGLGYFDFIGFKLIPVRGTNAYIIIRSVTNSQCVQSFFCTCPREFGTCQTSWRSLYCECPCSSFDRSYSVCENNYNRIREQRPCTPIKGSSLGAPKYKDLSNLPQCYNISLSDFQDMNYDEVTLALIGTAVAVTIAVAFWGTYHSHKFAEKIEVFFNYRKQLQEQGVIANLTEDLFSRYTSGKKRKNEGRLEGRKKISFESMLKTHIKRKDS